MIIRYGRTPLPLLYTEEEIYDIISQIIFETDSITFSYSSLCSSIKNRAIAENKFKMENNTQYTDIVLSDKDCYTLTRILWNLIWDKKLMIDFNSTSYRANNNDTIFYILK